MKWTKTIVIALYALIAVCVGLATIVEKYRGTSFVGEHIYGAWWFVALWAILTVCALAYIMQQRLYKRFAVMLLHFALVVILAGALTTHLFAESGTVRLRTGMTELSYADKDSKLHRLPFSLTLKEFNIVNYPGTDAPLDYQSVITYSDDNGSTNEVVVSMNSIGYVEGYRLFQRSYDSDGGGVALQRILHFGRAMLVPTIRAKRNGSGCSRPPLFSLLSSLFTTITVTTLPPQAVPPT